eukprot:1652857-Rhodomonas_salina.1
MSLGKPAMRAAIQSAKVFRVATHTLRKHSPVTWVMGNEAQKQPLRPLNPLGSALSMGTRTRPQSANVLRRWSWAERMGIKVWEKVPVTFMGPGKDEVRKVEAK